MGNTYLEDAYASEIKTGIIETSVIKKKTALCFSNNIYYPGGGGQPADSGCIELPDGRKVLVTRILKQGGKILVCLNDTITIEPDAEIMTSIDWDRRYRFMRYHTAAHVLMGSVRRNTLEYVPEGIDIKDDGVFCVVNFDANWDTLESTVKKIIDEANGVINENRKVLFNDYSSLKEAQDIFQDIYRGPMDLSGPVRIIVVENWDANPCGGTHVKALSEVGNIYLKDFGSNFISFSLS